MVSCFLFASLGSLVPLPRWEFCVDETLKFFPHAINGLLAENCELREEKREKVIGVGRGGCWRKLGLLLEDFTQRGGAALS